MSSDVAFYWPELGKYCYRMCKDSFVDSCIILFSRVRNLPLLWKSWNTNISVTEKICVLQKVWKTYNLLLGDKLFTLTFIRWIPFIYGINRKYVKAILPIFVGRDLAFWISVSTFASGFWRGKKTFAELYPLQAQKKENALGAINKTLFLS